MDVQKCTRGLQLKKDVCVQQTLKELKLGIGGYPSDLRG